MTTRLLSGGDVWPHIHSLAAGTKARKFVATAFIGPNSVQKMHLGKGDILICALSNTNVRLGVVCAPDLIPLRKRGVAIYAIESLHAKIYLMGKTAVIGSANVSTRSTQLDEAAVTTTAPALVSAVRQWFLERTASEPVSMLRLQELARVYQLPKWTPFEGPLPEKAGGKGAARQSRAPDPRAESERWWMLWDVVAVDDDELEAADIRSMDAALGSV